MPANVNSHPWGDGSAHNRILVETWCWPEFELPKSMFSQVIWDQTKAIQIAAAVLGVKEEYPPSPELKAAVQRIWETALQEEGFSAKALKEELGWDSEDTSEVHLIILNGHEDPHKLWEEWVAWAEQEAPKATGDDTYFDYWPGCVVSPMRTFAYVFGSQRDTMWNEAADRLVKAYMDVHRDSEYYPEGDEAQLRIDWLLPEKE